MPLLPWREKVGMRGMVYQTVLPENDRTQEPWEEGMGPLEPRSFHRAIGR